MNQDKLQEYKARLAAEREALLAAHGRHERDLRDSHQTSDIAGPDRAAELDEARVEAALVESEKLLLDKIVHALLRVETGAYGACEACGTDIPEARLDAKPSVSLCVGCQEAKESAMG